MTISGFPGFGALGSAQELTIRPPPGFASDRNSDYSLVDIVYRGRRVAVTPARFDASSISFEDPHGLVALLPGVRDPAIIRRALERPQATNADLLCSNSVPAENCGFIQTSTIAVIFDEARLTAELFINSRFSAERDSRDRFVPPPTIAPAILSYVDTRAAYNFDTKRSVGNHRLRAIAGRGRIALRTEGFADAEFSGQVTAMYATHSAEDRAWSAGLIPPRGSSGLARSRRMFGVRFGTLLESRTDQDQLRATPIEISVAQSATVELQRDGQTLDVQQIEPGQIRLDTRRLPAGSYALDLIITEGGQARTETRFFSSNSRLPPAQAPRWYVELGNAVPLRRRSDGFEDDDPIAVAFGWAQRLGANWGVRADGFLSNDVSFLELETGLRAANWRGDASILLANDGGAGYALQVTGDVFGYQMRGSYRVLDRQDAESAILPDAYDPIPNSFEQASVSISRSAAFGRWGLRSFYSQNNAGRSFWFAGPYADIPILHRQNWRLNMNARGELGSERDTVFLGLRLTKQLGAKPGMQFSSRIDTRTVNARADEGPTTQAQIESELRKTIRPGPQQSGSVFAGLRYDDRLGARAGANVQTPWFRANLDGRHNYQNQNTALFGMRTGAIFNSRGMTFAHQEAEAGARVSLVGDENVPVSILVDGAPRLASRTGRSPFVPLETYSISDIGVRPLSSDDLAYDQRTSRMVAYPGNVITVRRALAPVFIIVGQLMGEDGQPIADANLIDRGIIGTTDALGYFQIDGTALQRIEVQINSDDTCAFTLPNAPATERPFWDLARVECD